MEDRGVRFTAALSDCESDEPIATPRLASPKLAAELPADVRRHILNRIEIHRVELAVSDFNPVRVLQEPHEFEHTGGVNHSVLQERVLALEGTVIHTEQEIADDEIADGPLDRVCV